MVMIYFVRYWSIDANSTTDKKRLRIHCVFPQTHTFSNQLPFIGDRYAYSTPWCNQLMVFNCLFYQVYTSVYHARCNGTEIQLVNETAISSTQLNLPLAHSHLGAVK